jgi:hypothetical protein
VELVENSEMSITEKANLRQAKRQRKLMRYDLNAMKAVPPTANLVERLFRIGHILTSDRKSMNPAGAALIHDEIDATYQR